MEKGNALRKDKPFIPPKPITADDLKEPLKADEFYQHAKNVNEASVAAAKSRKRKICILGTAPQWNQAPFGQEGWEFWGIFGVAGMAKLDRLYELHKAEEIIPLADRHACGKYWEIANELGANFITRDALPKAPNAVRFDFEAKRKKYGDYFASSCAWLIAEAIDLEPEEIAIYGVNMAHDTEYGYQKPSCTYMLGFAAARGIKITVPKTSELLQVPYLYGLQDEPQTLKILDQKIMEIEGQKAVHQQNFRISEMAVFGCEQVLQNLRWMKMNFK